MALFSFRKKGGLPMADEALPGRAEPIKVPDRHFVTRRPIEPPFPEGLEQAGLRARLLLGRGAEVLADRRAC